MPSQGRPAFNQVQEQAGLLGLRGRGWRKIRGELLFAIFSTLSLLSNPEPSLWIPITLVWIGTLFSVIEAWPSRNPVKISGWIRLIVTIVVIWYLVSNPGTFLNRWVCSLCAAFGTDICQGICVGPVG